MDGDVSKRTLTVLVILTVIISVLGTLSVMSAMAEMNSGRTIAVPSDGYVALEILPPAEQVEAAPVTGQVALEILPPEKPNILLLPE